MRFAVVEIEPVMLPDVVGVMADHDLQFETSLYGAGKIALVISGPGLPVECEEDPSTRVKQVSLTFQVDAYGRQRMTRVCDIKVVPRTVGLNLPLRSAA